MKLYKKEKILVALITSISCCFFAHDIVNLRTSDVLENTSGLENTFKEDKHVKKIGQNSKVTKNEEKNQEELLDIQNSDENLLEDTEEIINNPTDDICEQVDDSSNLINIDEHVNNSSDLINIDEQTLVDDVQIIAMPQQEIKIDIPTEIPIYIEQIDINTELWGNVPLYNELYTSLQIHLPREIKNIMRYCNLKIVFIENTRGIEQACGYDQGEYNRTMGLFKSEDNAIYLETMDRSLYDYYVELINVYDEYSFHFMIAQNSLFHEIGHYLDYISGGNMIFSESGSNEFISIYYNEYLNFMNTEYYNTNNLSSFNNIINNNEYFATAFAAYIFNPNNLYELCPNTYNYIHQVIEQLKLDENKFINGGIGYSMTL